MPEPRLPDILANRTFGVMDNLRFLLALPAECIDLIPIDPPFGKMETFKSLPKIPITDWEMREERALAALHDVPYTEFGYTQVEDLWEWERDIEKNTGHARFMRELRAEARAYDERAEAGETPTPSLAVRLYRVIDVAMATAGQDEAAYIAFMAQRLVECHRVLKPTGSIYVHCDDKSNSHLRMLMDAIFGADNFRNEITWRRVLGGKSDAGQYPRSSDKILFYTKGQDFTFHAPRLKEVNDSWYRKRDSKGRYSSQKLTAHGSTAGDSGKPWRGKMPTGHWVVPNLLAKRYETETGKALSGSVRERLDVLADAGYIEFSKSGLPSWRRYLSEANPPRVADIWSDDEVKPISRQSPERTGYATQKPLALLERIIAASSNEGDVVLDVFGGCATTAVAAERLGRQWIVCDHAYRAWTMIKRRFYEEGIALSDTTDSTPDALASKGGGVQEHLVNKESRTVGPNDVTSREQVLPALAVARKQVTRSATAWSGSIPKARCKELLEERWGCVCWGCGKEPNLPNGDADPEDLQVDHLYARRPDDADEGGDDELYNLCLLCAKCNRRKGNRLTLAELRDDREAAGLLYRDGRALRKELHRERLLKWAMGVLRGQEALA